MGLCAGLGILFLQAVESWQGVQALASARVMWLAGCWLLAGILGWGCSRLCLPHGCLLAGWCWQLVGKGPDGPQLAPARWQSLGNVALLAWVCVFCCFQLCLEQFHLYAADSE